MRPERTAKLVLWWARRYTRGVPAAVAERRVGEIEADVHDQIEHDRTHGVRDARIACSLASRTLRGVPADLSWRRRQPRTPSGVRRSAVRIGLVVAAILSVPFVATYFTDSVVWSAADFVAAGILLAVVVAGLELAVKRAGGRGFPIGMAAAGIAVAIFGNADDAPGLVLLGILLVVDACAIAVRRAQRRPG
jgi:hypothetical protein